MWGPYQSAVSMKLTPSSTARRRTANAPLRSFGGPQMPSPVRRMAPKPRRCTEISPPSKISPAKLAESSFLIMIDLQNSSLNQISHRAHGSVVQRPAPDLFLLMQRANVPYERMNLIRAERTLEGRHSPLTVGNDLSELPIGQVLDCR